MRIIFHIDVNNAFLSWTAVEYLKDGFKDIRKFEAVIGGKENSRNGVVLAKSISAKKCGVVTGEPIVHSRKKCPNLEVYPPNYKLYSEMSKNLFLFLRKYTPDIEVCSIDECFIDYTPVKKMYGDEKEFAKKIQSEIFEKFGFTVNIGIANNKLCAKMASDLEKPNKIITIYDDEIEEKMWNLDINELYGCGKKTSELLNKINIFTIGDLANYDENKLRKYFKNRAHALIDMARGIDDSVVVSDNDKNKCISSSTTFEKDEYDEKSIIKILDKLIEKVTFQLREQGSSAYVVGIIIKDAFFKTKSHQVKLKNATNETKEIKDVARKLFLKNWNKEDVRLIGVKVEQLVSSCNYQMSLFEEIKEKDNNKKLDETVDQLYKKYGSKVIKKWGRKYE